MSIGTIETKHWPARILLVEDNYGDVTLTRHAFRQARIPNEICIAGTGKDALAMLRKEGEYAHLESPDIVLLDLNLPAMSGHEVLETIKNDPNLKCIPVLILSSSEAEQDVVTSYSLHANGYIVKPVGLDKFVEAVNSIEMFWFTLVVLPNGEDVKRASRGLAGRTSTST